MATTAVMEKDRITFIVDDTPNSQAVVGDARQEGHLDAAVRAFAEGYAVAAYRRGDLSSCQVEQMLGFLDRAQTEQFLSEHQAFPNYAPDDFPQDLETLDALKLLDRPAS